MKLSASITLILALSAPGFAMAQSGGMKNMNAGATAKITTHQATGVVKAIDPARGTVMLAHGPVKSLNWSAMTMPFAVKDKTLFDKLAVGKNVTIDFSKQDADYVVTAVK